MATVLQGIGYYLQNLVQISMHTDTYEQLGDSAHKEMGRFVPNHAEIPDGPKNWIDDWTMFYWGWWISWSPFVGIYHLIEHGVLETRL